MSDPVLCCMREKPSTLDAKFSMISSDVEDSRLMGMSPLVWFPSPPLPWDESDCCWMYVTGGGEFVLGPAGTVVGVAADLGEVLPLLLDLGVDSREATCPAAFVWEYKQDNNQP